MVIIASYNRSGDHENRPGTDAKLAQLVELELPRRSFAALSTEKFEALSRTLAVRLIEPQCFYSNFDPAFDKISCFRQRFSSKMHCTTN